MHEEMTGETKNIAPVHQTKSYTTIGKTVALSTDILRNMGSKHSNTTKTMGSQSRT